jgi:hypothetical protein
MDVDPFPRIAVSVLQGKKHVLIYEDSRPAAAWSTTLSHQQRVHHDQNRENSPSICYLLYSLDLSNMEATCLTNIYIVSFFAWFGLHLPDIRMEYKSRPCRATMLARCVLACGMQLGPGASCSCICRHDSRSCPRPPRRPGTNPARTGNYFDTPARLQLVAATYYIITRVLMTSSTSSHLGAASALPTFND